MNEMANILVYEVSTGRVIGYLKSVDTSDWLGVQGAMINPDLSLLSSRDLADWRVDLDTELVTELTDAQKLQRLEDEKIVGATRIDADQIPAEILAIANVMDGIKPGAKASIKDEYKRILGLPA